MTVHLKVEAEIRRLYFAEHWKRGTIASELGVHFDTVVRVLGSFGPKAGSPRPEARVLETYIPFVDETLARYPRLVSTRIHDMLVERGYTGSLRTLRRYVLNARPAPKSEVFLRVETLPGEQAQVELGSRGLARDPRFDETSLGLRHGARVLACDVGGARARHERRVASPLAGARLCVLRRVPPAVALR